jgi:hypothetical protein
MRCVMTTFDPDTQRQKVGVLKEIGRKFAGKLALIRLHRTNAAVEAG